MLVRTLLCLLAVPPGPGGSFPGDPPPVFAPPSIAAAEAPAETFGEEVVEFWEDGTVRARFEVDERGVRDGPYRSFHRNGKRHVHATYRSGALSGTYQEFHDNGRKALDARYKDGQLHGKYVELDTDGREAYVARYRSGLLDGEVEAFEGKERVSQQRWEEGRIVEYDGLVPFPRDLETLRTEIGALLDPSVPLPGSPTGPELLATSDEEEAADPGIRDAREAGLRCWAAYRYLSGVPHEGLRLDAEFNRLATLGALVCEANGELSHTPPNPGWPEDRYRDGYQGANHSNITTDHDVERSIHGYMFDSDPSNIDDVGHRVWCLEPSLQRIGLGRGERGYGAMHVFDQSGPSRSKGIVPYPAAGLQPRAFFGRRHAWSLICPGGVLPALEDLEVRLRRLDERWIPGPPLKLDHLGLSGRTLVLRPADLDLSPGSTYVLDVHGLKGSWKKTGYRLVVRFVDLSEEGDDPPIGWGR